MSIQDVKSDTNLLCLISTFLILSSNTVATETNLLISLDLAVPNKNLTFLLTKSNNLLRVRSSKLCL